MSFQINEVRSVLSNMNGFELDRETSKIKPKGKIFFGGFNTIDEENGFFTLTDQDYNEAWKIEAKSLRSLKLKLNKVSLDSKNSSPQELKYAFKNAYVVTRSRWITEILKRDQAVQEEKKN